MLKIFYSKDAKKSLKKFKKSDLKLTKRIIKKIKELQSDPNPISALILVNYPPFKRVKVGKYRIIYKNDKFILNIAFVDKREDVYENLLKLKMLKFIP